MPVPAHIAKALDELFPRGWHHMPAQDARKNVDALIAGLVAERDAVATRFPERISDEQALALVLIPDYAARLAKPCRSEWVAKGRALYARMLAVQPTPDSAATQEPT